MCNASINNGNIQSAIPVVEHNDAPMHQSITHTHTREEAARLLALWSSNATDPCLAPWFSVIHYKLNSFQSKLLFRLPHREPKRTKQLQYSRDGSQHTLMKDMLECVASVCVCMRGVSHSSLFISFHVFFLHVPLWGALFSAASVVPDELLR